MKKKVLSVIPLLFFTLEIPVFSFQTPDNSGSIGGLLGQLGAASAIVIVVGYFLGYLKDQGKMIGELKDSNLKIQSDYRESIETLAKSFTKRQEDLQDFFEKQLTNITAAQNEVLHETIVTVKALERTLDNLQEDIELVLIKAKTKRYIGSDDDIKILEDKHEIKIKKEIEDAQHPENHI
jgi:hypothetical protein